MVLTRNLHIFQDIFELKVENKNFSLDKTVLIIWYQILQKIALTLPHKIVKKYF